MRCGLGMSLLSPPRSGCSVLLLQWYWSDITQSWSCSRGWDPIAAPSSKAVSSSLQSTCGWLRNDSQAYNNSWNQCGPLLLVVWFLLVGIQVCFRGVRLTIILINLFLSTATYIFSIVVVGPVTINTINVISSLTPCSYDFRWSSKESIVLTSLQHVCISKFSYDTDWGHFPPNDHCVDQLDPSQ